MQFNTHRSSIFIRTGRLYRVFIVPVSWGAQTDNCPNELRCIGNVDGGGTIERGEGMLTSRQETKQNVAAVFINKWRTKRWAVQGDSFLFTSTYAQRCRETGWFSIGLFFPRFVFFSFFLFIREEFRRDVIFTRSR